MIRAAVFYLLLMGSFAIAAFLLYDAAISPMEWTHTDYVLQTIPLGNGQR